MMIVLHIMHDGLMQREIGMLKMRMEFSYHLDRPKIDCTLNLKMKMKIMQIKMKMKKMDTMKKTQRK